MNIMSYSYIKDTALLIQAGWQPLSGASFGGVTYIIHAFALEAVSQCEEKILVGEAMLAGLRSQRDDKLKELGELSRLFYYGVMCAPDQGEDSPFLSQCGYIRRSDRSNPTSSVVSPTSAG